MTEFSNKLEFVESQSLQYNVLPPARSSTAFIRDLIEKSKSKRTKVSFVYKELLRSVINTFSDYSIINDEEQVTGVKCIFANPERAVAKLTQETNLILPIISISQPRSKKDNKRQRYGPNIYYEKYWDEKKQRAIRVVSLVDSPIEVEYELTVWAKYKNDLDQITEQIHLHFNPDISITTNTSNVIKLFLLEEASDSDLVLSDREDRILKRVFTLTASTYVPSPKFLVTSTGKIEEFNYEVEVTKRIV